MAFELPPLPYAKNALEPVLSEETLEYHYGKHHQAYVTNLNKLVEGSGFEGASLEEIIKNAGPGPLFNNAAQVWNHTFYWRSLAPEGTSRPSEALQRALGEVFGSFEEFKSRFVASAVANFGSGWTWLVKKDGGGLDIVNTGNAGCPVTEGAVPLLTVDVWEHAYYIDYRNARPQYLQEIWRIVDWGEVERRLGA